MAREKIIAGLPRVGCIVLDADLSLEPDLATAFSGTVGIHIARLPYDGAVTAEALQGAYRGVMTVAATLSPLHPSLVIYACTSGSFIQGVVAAHKLEKELKGLGGAGETAISAVISSVRELGVKRLAVLSPYSSKITSLLVGYLSEVGVTVNFVHLIFGDRTVDDVTLQSLGWEELKNAVSRVPDSSDGIFISCTGVRITPFIEDLEKYAGRPVVSSNLAIIRTISKHVRKPTCIRSKLTDLELEGAI